MNNTKVRRVIDSTNLLHYKVKAALLKPLRDWEEMVHYMKIGGRTPPDTIRLFVNTYAEIDELVRHQSDGKYGAADVRYKGHALTR